MLNITNPNSCAAFRQNLLTWYQKHKRALPFRKNRDPYRIWLSEIMAQQTTLPAVIPYFERFVARFPTLQDVAKADEMELLKFWQGLGYYSRVRNLQKAAVLVLEKYGGKLPKKSDELAKLPGIGPYTARAIASICHDEPVAVIDGNVKRVLARLFWYDQNPSDAKAKTFFETHTQSLLDKKNPGDFNQAIMELGALICRPKAPSCLLCPVNEFCEGRKKNPENVPQKKQQNFLEVTYHSLLCRQKNRILLKRPNPESLIRNMWELPSVYDSLKPLSGWKKNITPDLTSKKLKPLGSIRHSITNKKITVQVFHTQCLIKAKPADHDFIAIDDLEKIPINTISRKILQKFL